MKFSCFPVFNKQYYLFFLFIFSAALASDTLYYKQELKRNKIEFIETQYSQKQAELLLTYWDNLYPDNKIRMYDYLSHFRWEKILIFQEAAALKVGDIKVANRLAFVLGVVFHRQTKFEKAIPYLEKAIKKPLSIRADQYENALLRLEYSYLSKGTYAKAIDIRRQRVTKGFSDNFWDLYSVVGMHSEALKEFKVFEELPNKDDFEKIRYFNKLGKLFLANKNIDSAFFYFKKMEQQADYIIKNKEYKGKNDYTEHVKEYFKYLAYSQQGECLLAKKEYKKAIPVLKKVIPYCNNIKEVDQKIYKWLSLSKAFNALKKPSQSFVFLDSIKFLMVSKRMLDVELDWLKQRAISNKLNGNNERYFSNMQQYFYLKDSVDFENQKNRSFLLLAETDVNQKRVLLEKEREKSLKFKSAAENKNKIILFISICVLALLVIVFLIYLNLRLQKRAKNKLKIGHKALLESSHKIEVESNKNEFLLKEIHHRTKNNLQMISSLLSLQKNTVESVEVQQILNDCKARIKTMSLVHQQLYESDNLGKIYIESYLNEITSNTLSSYGTQNVFEPTIKAPFYIDIDTAVYLGLISNEILTNSIKHNKESKIDFSILLTLDKDRFTLQIKDNGIGFTTAKKTGFGFQLISILANQVGGDLVTKSELHKGVSHTITFLKPV